MGHCHLSLAAGGDRGGGGVAARRWGGLGAVVGGASFGLGLCGREPGGVGRGWQWGRPHALGKCQHAWVVGAGRLGGLDVVWQHA
jgi:hypothetical protein